jgi:hypothetical protein
MIPRTPEITPTEEEARLGFEAQTLTYPEGQYELSGLKAPETGLRERTVAVALDDTSRIRRRHGAAGYVREVFDGVGWTVADVFESLREVEDSDAYRDYGRRRDDEEGCVLEEEATEEE